MRLGLLLLALLLFASWSVASCFDVPVNAPPKMTTEVEDWRDEIIYQILVDRFENGDKNNDYNLDLRAPTGWHGGDWQGIIDRLDYIEELGVTALWISPNYKNVEQDAGISGYHGYWPQDFVSTNPHFGDMNKLRELVAESHKRGIKVIFDVVVNHIGQLFYYDINLNGRPDEHVEGSGLVYDQYGGARSDLVRVTEWDPDFDPRGIHSRTSLGEAGIAPIRWVYMPEDNRVPPMPKVFQNDDWYNRKGRVVTPWGWNHREQVVLADFPGGLKDIKTSLPEVQQEMIRVWTHWILETNADGFRIDTVKHVEDEFWKVFAAGVRKELKAAGKNNFLMFGEIFDGDDALLGHYTKDGMLDSVFYFSHKYQVFDDVFKRGGATKKIEDLYNARQANYGTTPHPNGIVDANGQGIAPTRALVTFLDNHDVARFLYEFNQVEGLRAALFYLLTADGIPCIYYGTEQDFEGGNDPANREDMWPSQFDTSGTTFKHVQQLNQLRKKYAPLRRGNFQLRWTSERTATEQDAGIVAFERSYNGESVLVVVNAHASKTSETSATSLGGGGMPVSFAPGTVLVNVFQDDDANKEFVVAADGTVTVSVKPRSGKILVKK
ncbi:MAG: alpha-amylase [Bradymonadaceae bacterium]|nr:alpha-amylase [Lujinxingiaceae bacterium]